MKIQNISKIDVLFFVSYLFFAFLLVMYVFYYKKKITTPTYKEIPKQDQSLLLNDTFFSKNNFLKNSQGGHLCIAIGNSTS